ncbi:MAG TPA: thrombospondin type-1 domain-containing protein, partial [Acidobacteriota bacterium]|nr:thrombospondin type-1 domain-containing protein [Acidobacteriota bacterium]
MKMRCVLGLVLFVLCMTGVFATCSVDSVQCFVDGMEQNCAAATYGKTVTQVTISSSNYQSDLVTATISRTGPFATSIASGTAVYDTASFKHIWNTTQQMDRSGVYEITATCSPLTCPGPGGITVANGATVYFYPNNIGIDAAACTKEPRVCSAGVLNGTATYSDCYYWSASPFGACTGSCPTGTMTRTVSCMSAETGLAVADIQCAGAIKPATNASCTIACPGSGACGTAAKAYDYYDTTYGSDTLCDINGGSPTPASPAFPNAGTTVTWTCSDANHTAVACTSSRYDGVCGTAASKIYQYSATGFGSDSLCAVGTSNPAVVPFPSPGASQSWICSLAHTGFGVTCSTSRSGTPPAQNGQCGSANGRFFSAADTSFGFYTVCSYGASIPGTVPFPSAGGVSSWICQGTNGGADASCSASREAVTTTNGACGSADGKTYPASASSFGSDTLCAAGSVNPAFVSFPSAGSSVLWSCKGAGSPVGTDD